MPQSPLKSPTHPIRIRALEREERALTLRARGDSYSAIGNELSMTKEGARRLILRGLDRRVKEHSEAADLIRAEEVVKLDSITKVLMPSALAGDYLAIDRVVRIADRKAKLLGLDVIPERPEHSATTIVNLSVGSWGAEPPAEVYDQEPLELPQLEPGTDTVRNAR